MKKESTTKLRYHFSLGKDSGLRDFVVEPPHFYNYLDLPCELTLEIESGNAEKFGQEDVYFKFHATGIIVYVEKLTTMFRYRLWVGEMLLEELDLLS